MVLIRFDLREMEQELGTATMKLAQEVAVELSNQLSIEVPVGATGRLQESFQIFRSDGGVVYVGTRVPYAKGVWKGRPPHEPDFEALQTWARRKLGDQSAAGPVFTSIKQEGTDPNDFVGRAVDNTVDRMRQKSFGKL